ncbi:MAG: PilZ domain-containing protein [Marinobacter sp.]|uniref:PilZ domain-containing protein n=1 Tax=Marinobacter sp. TaxID=50741 RepID=UPI0034A09A5C
MSADSSNHYSLGAPSLDTEDDQRSEFRLTGRATVSLQLEAPDLDEDDPGKTIVCHTQDLSSSGVRVKSLEPVPVGALLPLSVRFEGDQIAYQLTGEVVWIESRDDGYYWIVGVKILKSDDTSFVEWVEAVAKVMAED